MTDNELVLTISGLFEPLKIDIQEMKDDIQEMKDDIQELMGLKEDVAGLKEDVVGLKEDVAGLKEDVAGLKDDMVEVKSRVKKIELTQENDMLPRLRTIEACYTSTFDRYRESVEDYEEMKRDISTLKTVVEGHSDRLQRIS